MTDDEKLQLLNCYDYFYHLTPKSTWEKKIIDEGLVPNIPSDNIYSLTEFCDKKKIFISIPKRKCYWYEALKEKYEEDVVLLQISSEGLLNTECTFDDTNNTCQNLDYLTDIEKIKIVGDIMCFSKIEHSFITLIE